MLRVGERVLLLALSEETDKRPLGYLSSRLLTDVEGGSAVGLPFQTALVHQRNCRKKETAVSASSSVGTKVLLSLGYQHRQQYCCSSELYDLILVQYKYIYIAQDAYSSAVHLC